MNFEDTDFRIEQLDKNNPFDTKLVAKFLEQNGFEYKPDEVDLTMIIYNLNNDLIGTGSLKKHVLKFVVVASKFRESTAFSLIVTYLTNKALEEHKRCFVYTRPQTAILFESLGFSLIAKAEPLFAVLEFGYRTINSYLEYLKSYKKETLTNNIAAIVVNCNPFTLGHQYLIEKAASENEVVYVFVVEEDLSSFPYQIRLKLIKEGTVHLSNVIVVSTGPYIVSGATFPNYFLKNEKWSEISQKQAEIDVTIFAKYIVPTLEITKRYVGTENYCVTTAAYNLAMKNILPQYGCEFIEVIRKALGENENEPNYISASKVRKAIKDNKLNEILYFLPESTRNYLMSEESLEIKEKIKNGVQRH